MPFSSSGLYIDAGEKAYEVESSYYLEFQIKSALFSIKKIYEKCEDGFENKCQYYHYYVDHLLFSLGQIGNRFIIQENDRGMILERKQANRANFEFSEDKYPILSDKNGRNTIEHIDEYDQKAIKKETGVGGFNVIDSETPSDLISVFKTRRSTHIYTLNLIDNELLICRSEKEINIDLAKTKQELVTLLDRVVCVKEFLQRLI